MTHAQKAHAELIAAYFRGIRDQIDHLEGETAQAIKSASACASPWRPASEVPPEGRYIVRTRDGATYFLGPVAGRWMSNVVKWMEIPE